jgi:hypothetical protein
MKTTPIQGPMTQQVGTPTMQSPQQQAARDRAISLIKGAPVVAAQNSTPIPVNANDVGVEQLSAVNPPSRVDEGAITEATEVPTVEPKPKADDEKPLSDKYQILARKERALRAKAQQQDQNLRQKEQALKAKEAELQAKYKNYDTNYIPKSQLKQAALDALTTGELSYDEVTERMLSPTDPKVMTYIQRLEAKVKQLEQGVEETKTNYANSQDQAYKAAVNQIRTDVKALVQSDPNFETIKATRSINDVVDLIEKTFKEDGILLSVDDACNEVENYLIEETMKIAKLSKIQKRIQTAPAAQPARQEQKNKQPQPMKTLTNAAGSTRQLSARERALLAFKGQLKA